MQIFKALALATLLSACSSPHESGIVRCGSFSEPHFVGRFTELDRSYHGTFYKVRIAGTLHYLPVAHCHVTFSTETHVEPLFK